MGGSGNIQKKGTDSEKKTWGRVNLPGGDVAYAASISGRAARQPRRNRATIQNRTDLMATKAENGKQRDRERTGAKEEKWATHVCDGTRRGNQAQYHC